MKIYLIDDLIKTNCMIQVKEHWFLAKPENVRYSLRSRSKAAFKVLSGKATPVYFAQDVIK